MMLTWIYLYLLTLQSTPSEARSIGKSILFTEYTTDARRNSQIFAGLLKRPEYINLKDSKVSPIFLKPPTIPATAIELENLYRKIKNDSIYVQIGPDNYYGPSFFPKQKETNNPKITRKSFIGFDLSLTIQNSVIEFGIAHLVANLDVIRLAYILEVVETDRNPFYNEEIFGFLSGTVGQFRAYYLADYANPEELLNAVLVDDANVFVVKAKQESTLKILQMAQTKNILQHPFSWLTFNGGVTLTENDLNVHNVNFIAIELSPNGNLLDYPEFSEVPKPVTSRDLIFRDTAIFALNALAEMLDKQIENVSYITTTIEGVNQETIEQTWNFYSYVNTQYNFESSYKVTVLGNGSVSAAFQNLKAPPTTQEVLTMMQSRTLRLGTIVDPPLVTTELDANGKLVPKGPEITVAKEIMKRLNLSYEITIFDSSVNMRTDDGRRSLFKYLSQRDLDMLVGPFSVTSNRSADFQASAPVRSITYTFIYRNPSLSWRNQIFQFVVAFDAATWALIFVTAAIVGVALAVLHRIKPGSTSYTLRLSLLFAFGYLFQGVRTRPPTYASSQILVIVWWLFSLILVIAFCANYAAFRSFNALENLPNSPATLLHQKHFKYAYIKESNMGYLMGISLDSAIYSLYQMINTKFRDMIPNSRDEGINEVIKGQFALLDESPFSEYYARKYCLKSGPTLWFGAYAFFMPKQLSFGAIISEEIKKMRSDGTLDKIYKLEEDTLMSTLPTYCGAMFEDKALGAMLNPLIDWSEYSVELATAIGIFIASLIGLLIVLITLLVEYLLGIYKEDTN